MRDPLIFVGTLLLLGSCYGLFPGFAFTVLLKGRIRGEEELLDRELEGYREYTETVRYRLVPFLW